jgi:hypothetical protein
MQQEELTFKEFMDRFRTEEDWRTHFFNMRWPGGFVCPKCGHNVYAFIQSAAEIYTDGLNAYEKLSEVGYKHHEIKFSPEENLDHLHWLHTIISNVKAFIGGMYHGLDRKHLQRYFDEFCYRFNRRKFEGQFFNRLLLACIQETFIT